MKINELRPAKGAVKARKRIGRGVGSGIGKTSGKGQKGQTSRSGYSHKPHSEGGQTPLFRRLPKVGFTNINRIEYCVINLGQLNKITEDVITPGLLIEMGLVKSSMPIKVLGDGTLNVAKEIHANAFSKSAVDKINEAKGKVVEL